MLVQRVIQAWILIVAVGSLQPARPGPVRGVHAELHWFLFGVTALLLLLVSRNRRQEISAMVATCLFGLTLELAQHLIYHKAMEWHDVIHDLLAVSVVFALYHCVRRMNRLAGR